MQSLLYEKVSRNIEEMEWIKWFDRNELIHTAIKSLKIKTINLVKN